MVCRILSLLGLYWKILIVFSATSSTIATLIIYVSGFLFLDASLISWLNYPVSDSYTRSQYFLIHAFGAANINSSAIVAAASLVARTLYILATDSKTLSSSALNAISVNVSLVEELMGCLLDCNPGLSCELVKEYISPTSTCPSHYAGVILDEPSSTGYPGYVDDMSRFLWNFLADRTSIPSENDSSSCSQGCHNKGAVCIRVETDGKGVCVISTTRYFTCLLILIRNGWCRTCTSRCN